jgi:endoglycosylceramidase
MTARADRFMVPWLEWAYCGCNDPTTSGPGNLQAIVIDPAKAPAGSNLELPTLRALVEPYPQVIAGTPRSWSFDRARRRFTLAYSMGSARGSRRFGFGSLSEIAAPALVYGGRYAVRVTGGDVVSAAGASTVVIGACRGARRITVTVTPFGRNHSSCAIPR